MQLSLFALIAAIAATAFTSTTTTNALPQSSSSLPQPATVSEDLARIVRSQWIVKLRTDAIARSPSDDSSKKTPLSTHMSWLKRELAAAANPDGSLGYTPEVLYEYDIGGGAFLGYAVRGPMTVARKVMGLGEVVEYVEMDQVVTLDQDFDEVIEEGDDEIQVNPTAWGLKRISARDLPLPGNYTYPKQAGQNVTVYVIDTGVEVTHPQFESRAKFGANFATGSDTDGNGHGTHCAGTIASKLYGVAKKASIVGVKVLGADGSGSYAGVIAGIDWVAQNAVPGASVASMSLGGPKSQAVNDAVDAAVAKNIPFAVAAGNSYGTDACKASPAGSNSSYTVAASDINDALATFSDIGPCVEIIAPGVNVESTWIRNGTRTISGTSMATPHVAGVMALLLSQRVYESAKEVYDAVTALATRGKVSRVPANTVNLLLYNGWDV
ncbi:subtilisin-like serine protease [Quaeritorhiza haematococci]|nr:subtilisin-like serine protease [Quaeritorhiza haematococci]